MDSIAPRLATRGIKEISVFGSAALQMTLDAHFESQDTDIIVECFIDDVLMELNCHKTKHPQDAMYVDACDALVFRTAPNWKDRAHREKRNQIEWVFPHPLDILISKVHRLEPKDIEAFLRVKRVTGHPTPWDLIGVFQDAVDLLRPRFDEEAGGDLSLNIQTLFRKVYGREIDVKAEIIRPALKKRQAFYEPNVAEDQMKDLLSSIGEQTENKAHRRRR